MNKEAKKLLILAMALALLSIALTTANILRYENPKPEPQHITDKCEVDGKCYVETWIEVTPEEYIGLDIGDEYYIEP